MGHKLDRIDSKNRCIGILGRKKLQKDSKLEQSRPKTPKLSKTFYLYQLGTKEFFHRTVSQRAHGRHQDLIYHLPSSHANFDSKSFEALQII